MVRCTICYRCLASYPILQFQTLVWVALFWHIPALCAYGVVAEVEAPPGQRGITRPPMEEASQPLHPRMCLWHLEPDSIWLQQEGSGSLPRFTGLNITISLHVGLIGWEPAKQVFALGACTDAGVRTKLHGHVTWAVGCLMALVVGYNALLQTEIVVVAQACVCILQAGCCCLGRGRVLGESIPLCSCSFSSTGDLSHARL